MMGEAWQRRAISWRRRCRQTWRCPSWRNPFLANSSSRGRTDRGSGGCSGLFPKPTTISLGYGVFCASGPSICRRRPWGSLLRYAPQPSPRSRVSQHLFVLHSTYKGNALGMRNSANSSPVRATEVISSIDVSAPFQGCGSLSHLFPGRCPGLTKRAPLGLKTIYSQPRSASEEPQTLAFFFPRLRFGLVLKLPLIILTKCELMNARHKLPHR